LASEPIEIEGWQLRIGEVALAAKGGDLVLTATIRGDLPGRLILMARPGWDALTRAVRLTDLGYVFDAEQPDQALALGLY
jgi:hypothetical protein